MILPYISDNVIGVISLLIQLLLIHDIITLLDERSYERDNNKFL